MDYLRLIRSQLLAGFSFLHLYDLTSVDAYFSTALMIKSLRQAPSDS